MVSLQLLAISVQIIAFGSGGAVLNLYLFHLRTFTFVTLRSESILQWSRGSSLFLLRNINVFSIIVFIAENYKSSDEFGTILKFFFPLTGRFWNKINGERPGSCTGCRHQDSHTNSYGLFSSQLVQHNDKHWIFWQGLFICVSVSLETRKEVINDGCKREVASVINHVIICVVNSRLLITWAKVQCQEVGYMAQKTSTWTVLFLPSFFHLLCQLPFH